MRDLAVVNLMGVLKQDFLKQDFLKQDFLKQDFLKQDFLKQDFLKQDLMGVLKHLREDVSVTSVYAGSGGCQFDGCPETRAKQEDMVGVLNKRSRGRR